MKSNLLTNIINRATHFYKKLKSGKKKRVIVPKQKVGISKNILNAPKSVRRTIYNNLKKENDLQYCKADSVKRKLYLIEKREFLKKLVTNGRIK
jgi:hypothetical protein